MPKIKDIITIEKKNPAPYGEVIHLKTVEGYNQGQEELGNKSIVLDIGEVEKIVNGVVAKYDGADQSTNKSHVASDIAFSLKEQENKIIVEEI